jgi:hypothetical protein
MRLTLLVTTTAFVTAATALLALQQQPALVGAQFDVTSIKPNREGGKAEGCGHCLMARFKRRISAFARS